MSAARVRIYAQVGEGALLRLLADTEVASHAELPELLRSIADSYAELRPDPGAEVPAPRASENPDL